MVALSLEPRKDAVSRSNATDTQDHGPKMNRREGKAGLAPAGRMPGAGAAVPCASDAQQAAGAARAAPQQARPSRDDQTSLVPAWKCGLPVRRPPGPSRLSVCSAAARD
ncbi:hypothetical protein Rsub_08515 [Raphidocelis subcapitata]|uniref:Uncharacterized protein n=1 Tax=Raphidocelis subcapitata TaxID=307507 RepID=A0A2V0P6P1_9CHLO|nr:hypothetical protein Rsub_08515 [Raphidocelis subcapitata]|eukprot:GBF95534.1 hypothetical protein Rsub_08515 [Raphidocelis subcapitata]